MRLPERHILVASAMTLSSLSRSNHDRHATVVICKLKMNSLQLHYKSPGLGRNPTCRLELHAHILKSMRCGSKIWWRPQKLFRSAFYDSYLNSYVNRLYTEVGLHTAPLVTGGVGGNNATVVLI